MGRERLQRGNCAFLCVSEKIEKREAETPEMLGETEGGQSFSVLQDQISHLLRIHIDWH